MELNLLTQRMLAAGYKRDQIPPDCREWNDYYGGWTYDPAYLHCAVYETPCGLIGHVDSTGVMSHMGVTYCPENDNQTIHCPMECRECDSKADALRKSRFFECAVHEINPPEGWQDTIDLMYRARQEMNNAIIRDYAERRKGRYCPLITHVINGKIQVRYNILTCSTSKCDVCTLTGETLDKRRGNVYYDLCEEYRVGQDDLIGYSLQTSKRKGIKLFSKPVSMTLARRLLS